MTEKVVFYSALALADTTCGQVIKTATFRAHHRWKHSRAPLQWSSFTSYGAKLRNVSNCPSAATNTAFRLENRVENETCKTLVGLTAVVEQRRVSSVESSLLPRAQQASQDGENSGRKTNKCSCFSASAFLALCDLQLAACSLTVVRQTLSVCPIMRISQWAVLLCSLP